MKHYATAWVLGFSLWGCGGGTPPSPPPESGPFCGGIAAIRCPGLGQCVDNPSDGCDPKRGGADCGGICECTALAKCAGGSRFDRSPSVCSCVPDSTQPEPNPCAAVLCAANTQCVVEDGRAICKPIAAGVACGKNTCAAGQVCCNASCGICTPPDGVCIQIACE
ncbi:MAG TPA: hypothetical protein VFQ61_36445 [Polyangiaceae bacterium]|nr:hypothetical protein [Polyangiaceae bacterium]